MITIDAGTSAASLQKIIDGAAAGETISLGTGTFHFDRTIVINRDDISIVGQGSDQTHIVVDAGSKGISAFQIGSAIDNPTYGQSFALAANVADNSSTLTLVNSTGLHAGDTLWIEQANTPAYLAALGDTQWLEDKPLRTSMVKVVAVNGNQVTLENGVDFQFDARTTSVKQIVTADHVTVSGLSIDFGLGAADPGNFVNELPQFDRIAAVVASATTGLTLNDIDVINAPSMGFNLAQSIFINGNQLSVEGSHNKGDDGNGYAVQLRSVYDSSITHLSAVDTRHALVFASWTSEANNSVQIDYTNRDVNFHGGPDHNNVVTVDSSIRSAVEAAYMSPTLFVNESGTSYGAPTDWNANQVTFGLAWGTVRADKIVASDAGAELHTNDGADTLIGGAGNDKLYADNGNDLIVGSGGNDFIDGGKGADTLRYADDFSDYAFGKNSVGDTLVFKGASYDTVRGVESFQFADKTVALAGLASGTKLYVGTVGNDVFHVGGAGDVVIGGDGYDRVEASASYTLAADSEALTLTGSAALNGTGNAANNSIIGNGGNNHLLGLGGDDRIFGERGDDVIDGGDGNDSIYGQSGNDQLAGGAGNDMLDGGAGADVLNGGAGDDLLYGGSGSDIFVFSGGHDTVFDFVRTEHISLAGTGLTYDQVKQALSHAEADGLDTLATQHIDASMSHSGSQLDITIAVTGGTETMSLLGMTAQDVLSQAHWLF